MISDRPDFESQLRAALGDAYALERELTGSGMSRVFVATERALDRKVVIKVLPPDLAAGVNRERFRREIQLAAQLQHPHIVPLHTAGAHGDLLYFTMPFIEGESLRHALQEGVRFSPREVVRILHDVADALAYAHARGVVHRDIKPGNVLRSGSHAVVTDFGVAKAISAALPAVGMTTSGMAIGTPAYMAPEQLAGDPAADHRVDIYALGLLGYELLTGEAPFRAASPQETMAAQLTRVPEPISRKRPDAPPALVSLISRCLAKNPADRPQSAADVVKLLDAMDVASGDVAPLRRLPRAQRWVAAGLGLLVLATAAVAVLRSSEEPPASSAPFVASDSIPATPVPLQVPAVLTREDSLAIARAVQRKLAEQQTAVRAKAESAGRSPAAPSDARGAAAAGAAPGAAGGAADFAAQMTRLADSLRQAIEKAVLDSVARIRGPVPGLTRIIRDAASAESLGKWQEYRFETSSRDGRRPAVPPGPSDPISREAFASRRANPGPPRRIFVSPPALRGRDAVLEASAEAIVDSLRRALSRNPRYVLVPADSVKAALAKTRSVTAIARSFDVDLFASLTASLLPDSSALWTVTARDLTAHPSFAERTIAARRPPGAHLTDLDTLIAATLRRLAEMDRAPRRLPAGGR